MQYEEPELMGDDAVRAEHEGLFEADDVLDAPDTFEVELDGEVHTLPIALKGAILRHADYTRKTQDLADQRRAFDVERQALADDRRSVRGASADRGVLAALDHQLEAFAEIDWRVLGQEDAERARDLWASFQETQALRDQFAYALAHHENREELRAAREAAEEMAAAGAQLREEIDGWSPEVAAKLIDYGQAFGVTLEEFAQMADPRLWKLLHRAWRADQAEQGDADAQAATVRPAVTVGGGGGTTAGMRDELGTREWMRRRNAQMAGGR